MLTKKSLEKLLEEVTQDLIHQDIVPQKIILFGSYVNGGIHQYSDVDIAIWSEKFTGGWEGDFDIIRLILRKH